MWPIVADRLVCSVGRSVCLSVTIVSPAKTDVAIEMPFGVWTWVGQWNHVFDCVQIPLQMGRVFKQRPCHSSVY